MIADELLTRIGRLAFDIEEGRRQPELSEAIRGMLDDLSRATRRPPGDEGRRSLLEDVAGRLDALD